MSFISDLLVPARPFISHLTLLTAVHESPLKLHEIQEIYVFVVFFHTNLEKAHFRAILENVLIGPNEFLTD